MDLEIRRVSASQLVREAVSTVQPLADEKGIEIRVAPLAALPQLETDPDRVHQILLNLLSNAVKFTSQGSVTVAAGAESGVGAGSERSEDAIFEQERRWLAIRVSDTGPGIRPADHERIFHEFEQVAGTGARGGTGLGLAISRKFARLLGGELTVESVPGAGSTFTLRLPLLSGNDGQGGTPLAP